jgi:hypothetical protein
MIGPSKVKREEIIPIPPSPPNFLLFPSFILISSTDANRPPYSAGIPPLIKLISLMASALKTEKKPKR